MIQTTADKVLDEVSGTLQDEYNQITAWIRECKGTKSVIEQACNEGRLSEVLRLNNIMKDLYNRYDPITTIDATVTN